MAATGTAHVKVVPEFVTTDNGALGLAGAAGRLYQAMSKDTALQFTDAEAGAWVAFTRALSVLGIIGTGPRVVETTDATDPIRYVED